MFRLRDYRRVTIREIRFVGEAAAPPTYAIESYDESGDGVGSAEALILLNIRIGKWTWSTEGTNVGVCAAGISFTGHNTNNDQFSLTDVTISGCPIGVDLPTRKASGASLTTCLTRQRHDSAEYVVRRGENKSAGIPASPTPTTGSFVLPNISGTAVYLYKQVAGAYD